MIRYRPDFNERANLVDAYPQKAADLARQLRAWHATIPPCAAYATTPSCAQFSSAVFPGGGVTKIFDTKTANRSKSDKGLKAGFDSHYVVGHNDDDGGASSNDKWEDSEPDFWFDSTTGKHVSY